MCSVATPHKYRSHTNTHKMFTSIMCSRRLFNERNVTDRTLSIFAQITAKQETKQTEEKKKTEMNLCNPNKQAYIDEQQEYEGKNGGWSVLSQRKEVRNVEKFHGTNQQNFSIEPISFGALYARGYWIIVHRTLLE